MKIEEGEFKEKSTAPPPSPVVRGPVRTATKLPGTGPSGSAAAIQRKARVQLGFKCNHLQTLRPF